MTSRPRVALSLLLLLLPLVPGAASEAPDASGPDDEGAWRLGFDVTRGEAGPAQARLEVERGDENAVTSGSRDLGAVTFAAGPTRFETTFLPAEGSGRYTVALLLDGARVDAVSFDADETAAARAVAFEIPDAPTYLNLTNDAVNDAGKLKAPGDALLTRALVSDANGVAELDGVAWRIARGGDDVDEGAFSIAASSGATSAPIELRYDRAPLAAGAYTLFLVAQKEGEPVAEVFRTFTIKEVAPTFASGAIPNITPDANVTLEIPVVLADKNGAVGPGPIEARAYRGSTRVEGAGIAATLGAPTRLADQNGSARWSYPLALHVPAGATAGAYRVSLYANDTLLASLPYEILPLPNLRTVDARTEGGRLVLAVDATGAGILTARLTDGEGAATSVSASLPAGELALDAPRRGAALQWSVELRARTGGPVLAERNGTWSAPLDGPTLRVTPLHVRARLPATWALDAGGWDAAEAEANVTFTRWDGAPEPALTASVTDGRVRVDAPASLAAGRYHARLLLAWPNGSASQVAWDVDAGPWVELTLGAPVVSGRNATLAVHNAGGVPVTRIVAEAEPAARLTLRIGNATIAAREVNGRALFTGFTLAPGADAELRVELAPGPMRSGRNVIDVRVLAKLELG